MALSGKVLPKVVVDSSWDRSSSIGRADQVALGHGEQTPAQQRVKGTDAFRLLPASGWGRMGRVRVRIADRRWVAQNRDLGLKVKDGVYIGNYMIDDGRTELVKRYLLHYLALLAIMKYSQEPTDAFVELVQAYNAFWKAQTTTTEVLDPSALEQRIAPQLEAVIPLAYESRRAAVPELIEKAEGKARSNSHWYEGQDYFLAKAKSASYSYEGLKYYLNKAVSRSYSDEGRDYYINKAASRSYKDEGRDYYKAKAVSRSYSDEGLDYYLNKAKSTSYSDEGLGYVEKKAAGSAPAEEWQKVVSLHAKYEEVIRAAYDKFIGLLNDEYDKFEGTAKALHRTFVRDLTTRHAKFEQKIKRAFDKFESLARAQQGPSMARLKKAWSEEVPGRQGYESIKANMNKIANFKTVVSELSDKLDRQRSKMSKAMSGDHVELRKFYYSKYSAYKEGLEQAYKTYKPTIDDGYQTYREILPKAYRTIRTVFHSFLRQYGS